MKLIPKATRTHDLIFDQACPVCKHKAREAIEEMYVSHVPMKVIAGRVGITSEQIKAHAESLGLQVEKVNRTKEALSILQEYGYQAMESGALEISAKDMIEIAKHVDKVEGRIVERVRNERPAVIVISGIEPGGVSDATNLLEKAQEEVEMIPTFAGTKVEE